MSRYQWSRQQRILWPGRGLLYSGVGLTADDGYLDLPVYHHWNGETDEALPSHVEASPTITGAGKSPFVVDLNNPSGWTESILGDGTSGSLVAIIDLGGVINPLVPGIRILVLAKSDGTALANQEWLLTDHATEFYPSTDSIVYFQINENGNPDDRGHRRIDDGVTDFSESYTGHSENNSSGNSWRYYMFEQLAAGNTTWTVADGEGTQLYTGSRAYQGTSGVFPDELRYLAVRNNTPLTSVAQIWVGSTDDAWPTLPMSPMSNL